MYFILETLLVLVPVLISIAFLTLMERKLLSLVGLRLGPNKVSLVGLLQPIGDAVKLASKQANHLSSSFSFFYYFSSFSTFLMALLIWFFVCYNPSILSFKFGLLMFFLILGFNTLSLIISGWSTFGKYSLIGSLRSVAQLISYEASLYLCIFFLIFFYLTFDFLSFIDGIFFWIFVPLVLFCWVPSFLAELNRSPYDFSEGESELVSGFNVDFGSFGFTLIFLSEYGNICFFCLLSSYLFFCGSFFSSFFFFFFLIWIRSVLPRYRFDKLMMLCWKFLIPFLTFYFIYFFIFFV